MRTVHTHSVSLAAAAILVFAGGVAAQERASGLLNSLEVRQLIASAEPGAHARLSSHFTELGERYAAEARRHVSMSQSFIGNPNRNLGTGMSTHCSRLADLSTQAAATVRELAAYHAKLASGSPAAPPRDVARFHAGAGASEPTEAELNAIAAKASTPAQHRALEEYFRTVAKRHTAEANDHVTFAQVYRGTRLAQATAHHDRLAALARDAAKEAIAAADMHKQLAAVGR